MFERIYFCTECGLKKYKEQVHIRYGFAFRYNTERFNVHYPFARRWIYFRVLCICKKCFNNFAREKELMLQRIKKHALIGWM